MGETNNGARQFFHLVRDMREEQKKFSEGDYNALHKAKSLEKEVDKWIERGERKLAQEEPQQKELF